MRHRPPLRRLIVAGLIAAAATPMTGARAQLLGGGLAGGLPGGLPAGMGGGLPGAPLGRVLDPLTAGPLDAPLESARGTLSGVRRAVVARLLREHPDAVEADDHGAPVVRGEVVALAPSAEALAAAQAAGFTIGSRIAEPSLGLEAVVLRAPPGLSARDAVRRLRRLDPAGAYDFDHLYQEGGAAIATGGGRPAAASVGAPAPGARLGLVDGSVAAGHPALRSVRLTQQAFAPGGARVTAHATAVASLMVGEAGPFRGGAPGASLFVADVYGPTPAGGSAAAIVRGLGWLVQNRVGVIDVSLVGPPNRLLAAAVQALVARGVLLVAAVGNDGPAAPPLYPAAYPGVVGVTAVDARRKVLPEAGRGPQVAFAAPGAQMAAASPDGGYAVVRGTSFAAPLVAGELAGTLAGSGGSAAAAAVRRLAAQAEDLGAPGRDPVYGAGLVAFDRRTEPVRVGARAGLPGA